MYCPKCGKEIPNNSRICPKCGATLIDNSKSKKSASALDKSRVKVEGSTLSVYLNKKLVLEVLRGTMFYMGFMMVALVFGIFLIFGVISLADGVPFYLIGLLYLIIALIIYVIYKIIIATIQIYFDSYKVVKLLPNEKPLRILLDSIKEIVVSTSKILGISTYFIKIVFERSGKIYHCPLPIKKPIRSQEELEDCLEDLKGLTGRSYPIIWRVWNTLSTLRFIRER